MATRQRFRPASYSEAHGVLSDAQCAGEDIRGANRKFGKCNGIDAAYQAKKDQEPEQTYSEALAIAAARRALCGECPMNDLYQQELILAEEASE